MWTLTSTETTYQLVSVLSSAIPFHPTPELCMCVDTVTDDVLFGIQSPSLFGWCQRDNVCQIRLTKADIDLSCAFHFGSGPVRCDYCNTSQCAHCTVVQSQCLCVTKQSTPEPNSPNTTGNRWSIIIDKVIVRSEETIDLQFAPQPTDKCQSSGDVWKWRWTSWASVPNTPTVSVDVKQHFNTKTAVSFSSVYERPLGQL